MRSTHTLTIVLLLFMSTARLNAGSGSVSDLGNTANSLLFIENKGQVLNNAGQQVNDVLFVLQLGQVTTFIHRDGISYQFNIDEKDPNAKVEAPGLDPEEAEALRPVIRKTFRTKVNLVNANANAVVITDKAAAYYENYFFPQFPEGILNARSFQKITIADIYPGIDWVLYTEGQTLKYDFVVHPGADASLIKMRIDAADKIGIENGSNLIIHTSLGEIRDSRLYSYMRESGAEINSAFTIENNIISFDFDQFDRNQTLVVDPEIIYSTTYGANKEDAVNGMDLGPDGYFYGVGYTSSSYGIYELGFDSTYNGGSLDVHFLKFDTLGNRIWGTYYGGEDSDLGSNIHATDDGWLYITAFSESDFFPTTAGAFQESNNGTYDMVLLKFDTNGNRIWATLAGGWSYDYGRGVKADTLGNVYLAGSSYSSGLGYLGHQDWYAALGDQMLYKFDAEGNRLWSTYYGGAKEDVARDVCIGIDNYPYLVGYAESATNMYFNGMDSTNDGKHDCTLAKFTPDGAIVWGTYYGGDKDDNANDAEVDAEGFIYMASQMGSADMAVDGYQMERGGGIVDAMLTKWDTSGNIIWSTYFGGTGEDEGKHTRVIGEYVYLIGYAYSDGLAIGGFQNDRTGSADGIIARFDLDGNFKWSTYIGGSGTDYCRGIDGNNDYSAYFCGKSFSNDFPTTPGAFHEDYLGGIADGFIGKILLCSEMVTYYFDADGDGYGDDLISTESCEGIPVGYIIIGGDCNDADPAINPGATEICNALDEDCDFIIDEDAVTAVITASGPIEFCKGGSVTLNANADVGSTYQWMKNGANISGANASSYLTTKAGDYTVVVNVPGGCSDLSDITTVVVNAKPNPVVSPLGDLDICIAGSVKLKTPNAAGHTFQWYKDGLIIAGAVSNTYIATEIGSYKVKQTSDKGCSRVSLPVDVTSSCRISGVAGDENPLIVFPNPSSGLLTIELSSDIPTDEEVHIRIYNDIGEVIYEQNADMKNGILVEEIILPATISSGIYLLQAATSNEIYTEQIVVTK